MREDAAVLCRLLSFEAGERDLIVLGIQNQGFLNQVPTLSKSIFVDPLTLLKALSSRNFLTCLAVAIGIFHLPGLTSR